LYLAELNADDLENGTISLLLVKDFTGAFGEDIDTTDDGVIDYAPWSAIADSVGVHDGGTGDFAYGTTILTPYFDGFAFDPGGASRIPDGYDTESPSDWVRNDYNGEGLQGFTGTPIYGEAYNTPGAFNQIVEVVTFNVTVPDFTPGTVYIVGNNPLIGNWDPGAVAMTQVDATHWTIDIIFTEGTAMEFKFARGSWDTVMKAADGNEELANLTLTVAYPETGQQLFDYTVLNWQDPIVTAVTPLDGAVDVPVNTVLTTTWNQSLAAGSCFTLSDGLNTVEGSCLYDDASKTVTFTPNGELATLTLYTATAAGVVDAQGTTQQVPFTWTFTTADVAP
jgi:hypothetical protein